MQMVGELPFQLAGPPRKSKAPTWLPLELKDVWEQNEDMLFLQNQWVRRCIALADCPSPVLMHRP